MDNDEIKRHCSEVAPIAARFFEALIEERMSRQDARERHDERITEQRLTEIREFARQELERMPRYRVGLGAEDIAALLAEIDTLRKELADARIRHPLPGPVDPPRPPGST